MTTFLPHTSPPAALVGSVVGPTAQLPGRESVTATTGGVNSPALQPAAGHKNPTGSGLGQRCLLVLFNSGKIYIFLILN